MPAMFGAKGVDPGAWRPLPSFVALLSGGYLLNRHIWSVMPLFLNSVRITLERPQPLPAVLSIVSMVKPSTENLPPDLRGFPAQVPG